MNLFSLLRVGIGAVCCLSLMPMFNLNAAEALKRVGQFDGDTSTPERMAAWFKDPPIQYRSLPFYWLNGKLDAAGLRDQIQAMRDQCGFGGFSPLPMRSTQPAYLTDEYFDQYRVMLEKAEKLGLRVIFYDDIDFPTGTAGGRLIRESPDSMLKNLRKVEETVAGPRNVQRQVPQGTLMAAVAMETQTLQRIDLARFIKDGCLRWDAPAGAWKVMFFVCVPEGNVVDYLDPEAVDRFLALTYDEYAKRFGRFFGKTIVQSFFDDVALYYTSGQRTWTYEFNRKFKAKHGGDPALLYPALWYDIGPDTEAARVALFGFRAELFAEGFVRKVHEWCRAHGIQSSGHPMGPFNLQPVDVSGDNILFYRHCDIPLFDSIHYYGLGRPGFQLTTSAAFNYDKPLTAVEIYGAYPDNSVDTAMLYRSAMEVYVRGANLIIPHGMWYDPAKVTCPPEISHRSARLGAELPAYNNFVGRCSLLLQGGRHVADIGILYPITALQAAYSFEKPAAGGFGREAGPKEADYLKISDLLTGRIRRDFTFLHPEIVDQRCTVDGAALRLNNTTNREQYRVIIIPGGKVISWSNLRKLQQFCQSGGRVIATTQLPEKSAEFGHDADVRRTIRAMFGEPAPANAATPAAPVPYRVQTHSKGGKTYFAKQPTVETPQAILDDALPVGDVAFEGSPRVDSGGGMLSYLHKVKDGASIYYFADSSNDRIDTWVRLCGKLTLRKWDPHSGAMSPLECAQITEKGQEVTRVHLVLEPVKSVFLTEPFAGTTGGVSRKGSK
jgi:hypothetical protein